MAYCPNSSPASAITNLSYSDIWEIIRDVNETRAFETETIKIGLETSLDRHRSRDFNIPSQTI